MLRWMGAHPARTYRVCRTGFSLRISPYFRHFRFMFQLLFSMPEDEIAAMVRQLQETLSEVKETRNLDMRLTLLRHMRLLLLEADNAVDQARAESA